MPVKVYDGTNWVTVAGDGQQGPAATSSSIATWVKTASGGETSLSGNDDNSVSLSYTVGQELLYINGVLQKRAVDYVATTGTTITGLNALTASDVVTVWTVNAFSVTNAIPNSTVTAKGDLIVGTGSGTYTAQTVGTNGQVLTADSAEADGVKWATPSGSGFNFVTSQTFSAAAAQSVNSCFTSTYTNYRLIVTLSGVSADGDVRLFMRAAGTDNANSNNGSSWYGINATGTAVSANENGATSWGLFQTDSASNASRYFCVIDIANPQVTSDTGATWNSQYIVAATSAIAFNVGGALNYNATSYDGFTLKASAGNITGKVWVYGYSNS